MLAEAWRFVQDDGFGAASAGLGTTVHGSAIAPARESVMHRGTRRQGFPPSWRTFAPGVAFNVSSIPPPVHAPRQSVPSAHPPARHARPLPPATPHLDRRRRRAGRLRRCRAGTGSLRRGGAEKVPPGRAALRLGPALRPGLVPARAAEGRLQGAALPALERPGRGGPRMSTACPSMASTSPTAIASGPSVPAPAPFTWKASACRARSGTPRPPASTRAAACSARPRW